MPNPVQAWVHGKQGRVQIGGYDFAALSITFEESTSLEDITYTQSGGATARSVLPGYRQGSGSIAFIYDINNQPTISPFDLRPWSTSATAVPLNVTFYPDQTKAFTTTMFVERLSFTTGPQAGAVKCTVSFQTTGAITEPTS
jgi:hypothetical protein